MRRLGMVSLLLTLGLCGAGASAQGIPARVAALERQMAAVQSRFELWATTVDCAAGQTVSAALAASRRQQDAVVIRVRGVCVESVTLTRNDVTLVADAAGGTLRAPDGASTVLRVTGARVALDGLVIDGAAHADGLVASFGAAVASRDLRVIDTRFGVIVRAGAQAVLSGARVEKASLNGVSVDGDLVMDGAHVERCGGAGLRVEGRAELTNTFLEDNAHAGVTVYNRGSLTVWEGRFARNGHSGVAADLGSALLITRTEIVSNSGDAVQVTGGSAAELGAVRIEGSGRRGLYAAGGSSVRLTASAGSPLTIQANAGHGVEVVDTSLVRSSSTELAITGNGGWGVRCAPSPSLARVGGAINPATVFGNTAGQIDCPVLP